MIKPKLRLNNYLTKSDIYILLKQAEMNNQRLYLNMFYMS